MSIKRIPEPCKTTPMNTVMPTTIQDAPLVSNFESMTDSLTDWKELEGTDWFHPVKFSDTDGWILSS